MKFITFKILCYTYHIESYITKYCSFVTLIIVEIILQYILVLLYISYWKFSYKLL